MNARRKAFVCATCEGPRVHWDHLSRDLCRDRLLSICCSFTVLNACHMSGQRAEHDRQQEGSEEDCLVFQERVDPSMKSTASEVEREK